jgi:hypothetical protein
LKPQASLPIQHEQISTSERKYFISAHRISSNVAYYEANSNQLPYYSSRKFVDLNIEQLHGKATLLETPEETGPDLPLGSLALCLIHLTNE